MNAGEGMVFNIQRYSIDDGPGVRTTVFLKGCPLSCLWCSNPESLDPLPEVTWRYTSCRRCGTCVAACPEGAITLGDDGILIDRKRCSRCGSCVAACLPGALALSGKKMTVEEVWSVVKKDRDYYEVSGGGVTCSGGEVLAQPEFVAALFRRCRAEGVHTCADTSGWGSPEAMETVLGESDLVYFDLKHMDPAEHRRLCGRSNGPILRNLELTVARGVPLVVRLPLVPGCNDTDENLAATGAVVARLAAGAEVHLLPYHHYGESKYRTLGKEYPLPEVQNPAPEALERAKAIIESYGLKCDIKK
jgi:pyruvate formate lyase activating enzyme